MIETKNLQSARYKTRYAEVLPCHPGKYKIKIVRVTGESPTVYPSSPRHLLSSQITKESSEKIQAKDILVVKNPSLRTFSLGYQYPDEPPAAAASLAVAAPTTVVKQRSAADANDDHGVNVGHGEIADESAVDSNAPPAATVICGNESSEIASVYGTPVVTSRKGTGMGISPVPISYPGIQADPADMLLNGQSMQASFAPPAVRLANFDM